jgi:hypothetical protein
MAYPQTVSIYEKSTGIVVQTLHVEKESHIHIDSTHGFIVGSYKSGKYKIVDGAAQSYTPPYVPGTNTGEVRRWRNSLLKESDWTQVSDGSLSNSKKAEWVTYRQALRDLLASYSDSTAPEDVTWPIRPSA